MYELRDRIVIPIPKADGCRVCGELHDRWEPHNRNSLVYQHRFRKKHGRYPTWEDAMAHCGAKARERFMKRLERNGMAMASGATPADGTKTEDRQTADGR